MRRLTLQIAGSKPVNEKQLISSHSATIEKNITRVETRRKKKIANGAIYCLTNFLVSAIGNRRRKVWRIKDTDVRP